MTFETMIVLFIVAIAISMTMSFIAIIINRNNTKALDDYKIALIRQQEKTFRQSNQIEDLKRKQKELQDYTDICLDRCGLATIEKQKEFRKQNNMEDK